MIIQPSPIGNIWKTSAFSWLFSIGLPIPFYWMILYDKGRDTSYLPTILYVWAGIGILLLLIGKLWKEKPRRVLLIVFVGGVFGLFPFALMIILIGGIYFILADFPGMVFLRSIMFIIVIAWCIREVKMYAKRIKERHFIERELYEFDDHIVFARPAKTKLDPSSIRENTFIGKIYYNVVPKLVLLVPMAYPLQRLVSDYGGGIDSVLLLLSVLGTPLAIHTVGRLVCGAYLYVFKVIQIERSTGKPVVFEKV